MAFKWLRNPTLENGLTTTYCSKKGSDTTGDGTAQNPYASIAKATSVAIAGNNIMLDDGIWSQQRTLNSRAFKFWGNGVTEINNSIISMTTYGSYSINRDTFYFLTIKKISSAGSPVSYQYCTLIECSSLFIIGIYNKIIECSGVICDGGAVSNCIFIDNSYTSVSYSITNSIFVGTAPTPANNLFNYNNYNNYTTLSIPTTNGANAHSINNASTGQTVADYFNNYNLGDYTAKVGSANLGAGENKHDIGFSLGLSFYATDSVFTEVGGATLRNVIYENECFKITQRDKAVASATNTTIKLYTDASTVDDYYNGLIIGITEGIGSAQMREIIDYDGATQTATVATWNTNPDSASRYTITGLIISGKKDFLKSYKIAKNYLFANFGYNELTPSIWTELVAINPLVTSFGLKYSDFDDLNTKSWTLFGANGKTLYDGTYGDADNSHTIDNGKPIHIRFAQIQIPLIFNF